MNLGDCSQGRDNNFNLVRLLAALMVLFSHSFSFLGLPDPLERLELDLFLGTVAVDIFFIASGFLVTASLISNGRSSTFLWSRVLRIYPALTVMVALSVFGLGLTFTSMPPLEFLGDQRTWIFIAKNVTLLFGVETNLPGVVFNSLLPLTSPIPFIVNGSLWTLTYEVHLYLILLFTWSILGLLRLRQEKYFQIVIVLLALIGLASVFVDRFYFHWYSLFLRLFNVFFCGAAFYILKERITVSTPFFLVCFISLVLSAPERDLFFTCYKLFLPYVVFWLVYIPRGQIRNFNKLGDYSYGVYIFAYPIQQIICSLIPTVSIWRLTVMATIISLLFAYISWHFIESRALDLRRTLR
jgi:peptidoglycan/LPS O-acetylase OafA/YrhL